LLFLCSTLSLKNDTDVAHYNFIAHQLILVMFGRDVAERVCYRMLINAETQKLHLFSLMQY